MTRTGHVPRLQEAEPWPRVRLGAASLLALGLRRGIWCAFTTSWGSAAAGRAGRGAQGGRPSCPCTGPTASAVRGGQSPHCRRGGSPFGQPMFKQGRVRAEPQPTRWQGLWLGRRDWDEPLDWWARRPLPEGSCTLLASWSEAPKPCGSGWQPRGAGCDCRWRRVGSPWRWPGIASMACCWWGAAPGHQG